jgi:predicted nucleic acid-binding protein
MNRVVVDASALVALAFNEPKGAEVARRLEGAAVFAPALLKFEMANAAWKKARRQPDCAQPILAALATALDPRWGITWMEVDHAGAVLVSLATGLSTYDASYLWLAGILGADLVTLDGDLAGATEDDGRPGDR